MSAERKEQIQANVAEIKALKAEIAAARPIEELLNTMSKCQSKSDNANKEFKPYKLLQGHFGKIYAMDWGADDTTVLSAAQDGSLIIWNALTNNKLDVINLRSSWVMSCAMSPSGRMTASGGLDNLVTIYKLPDNGASSNGELQVFKELSNHTGYISGACFLDDNNVLSSSGDQTVVLWDIAEAKATRVFKGHQQDVMDVALIPNSNLFVSGSVDHSCKVWDHRDAKADVLTFVGHDSDVNAVDAMGNGHSFASGSDDHTLILHDMRSYGPLQHYRDAKIIQGVSSIAFSNSGRFLFGGYDDTTARCWDTLTGQKIQDLTGHGNRVSCLGVNKSGTALGTGGWDFLLRVWA
jgi:guanine nucleotide-binding protein G(I)/G(S)/G(T) subunit beta-1